MSQFFFNQRTHLVSDVIDGTIIASPWNNLARLEAIQPFASWSVVTSTKITWRSFPAAVQGTNPRTLGLSVKVC